MIIKNNFNSKDANPLNDYSGIGKGSHSLDKELDNERQGFIRENMNNEVLQDLREEHDETIDPEDNDKWKFFR